MDRALVQTTLHDRFTPLLFLISIMNLLRCGNSAYAGRIELTLRFYCSYVAMNSIYRETEVRCTTWYSSGHMKLWYVVQEKDFRTVTKLHPG
jgi:hypothetical protein